MIRTVGFPLNNKENEKRQALIYDDLINMENKDSLYFEEGYGQNYNITDDMLREIGVNVVSLAEVLEQNIICDPKIGDADYIDDLGKNKIIFGWIHAVQDRELTNKLIAKKAMGIAWEDMDESGRHIFWENNELAGEAAIMQAFNYYGKMPYDTKVAILGRGNVAHGAFKILTSLGAETNFYNKKSEDLFQEEMHKYDVIVNAITWDTGRQDHIIYEDDLEKMKPDAMIIDISCDEGLGIETSRPTTIENPTYRTNGILHYAVDHTPSIYYKTASKTISKQVSIYLPLLMKGKERANDVLRNAIITSRGYIYDSKIMKSQKRSNAKTSQVYFSK